MNITLVHDEIVSALIDFVNKQGITIKGKEINVSLIAGRGANGHSASIDITDDKNATPPKDTAIIRGTMEDNMVVVTDDVDEEEEDETTSKNVESLFGS